MLYVTLQSLVSNAGPADKICAKLKVKKMHTKDDMFCTIFVQCVQVELLVIGI